MSKDNIHYVSLSAWKRAFSRCSIHHQGMAKAKCPRKKGPRGGARYRCTKCKKDFGRKEVQLDHIEPVIPLTSRSVSMTWDEIHKRLFCSVDNLQVLCKACHKKKTNEENKIRRSLK